MKKAIIIIVAVIIIVGGGYTIYSHATSKAGMETISKAEVDNYQSLTKNFLYKIQTDNYTDYAKLCDSKIANKEDYAKIKSAVDSQLGFTKKITYIESEKKAGITINIYNGEFSKTTTNFNISFNKDGKIVGFIIMPSPSKEKLAEYNKITNTFMTAVNTGNYENYASVCTEKMGSKKVFQGMKNIFKDNLGNFKEAQYIESVKVEGATQNIYKGVFENKTVNVKVVFNGQNKIEGFFLD